jgi:hypothetical protein
MRPWGSRPLAKCRPLGSGQGATENAVVVASVLEELPEPGVKIDVPTLHVLYGAKMLPAAVVRVWVSSSSFSGVRRMSEAGIHQRHHEEVRHRLNAAHKTIETQTRTGLKHVD